jgi:hypothetical protein
MSGGELGNMTLGLLSTFTISPIGITINAVQVVGP